MITCQEFKQSTQEIKELATLALRASLKVKHVKELLQIIQ